MKKQSINLLIHTCLLVIVSCFQTADDFIINHGSPVEHDL